MYYNQGNITEAEARVTNPQVLAFVGDAVHTLYVRGACVLNLNVKPNQLHLTATNYIKASGQSDKVSSILPVLNEVEHEVYKRARNYKTNNIAKNATVGDYKRATGFEAVIGYLYLSGQHERMIQLLQISVGEIK